LGIKGGRGGPGTWVRIGRRNIGWDLATREEPNLDTIVIPQRSIDASAGSNETRTIRLRAVILNKAAFISVRLVEAIGGDESAGFLHLTSRRMHASLERMKRIAVGRSQINVLNSPLLSPLFPQLKDTKFSTRDLL